VPRSCTVVLVFEINLSEAWDIAREQCRLASKPARSPTEQQHSSICERARLPGDEAWLIGERRMSGEKKYYLANLPAKTDLRILAATIKARWICEQAHQQMKEELGLEHFEGRSWQGLHRHALMTMIAYAFLQHRCLAAQRQKKDQRATRFSRLCPRYTSCLPRALRSNTTAAMPALSKMNLQPAAA